MYFVQNWAWLVTWQTYVIYSTWILQSFCLQLTLNIYLGDSFYFSYFRPPPLQCTETQALIHLSFLDNLFFDQEHPSLNDSDKQKCEGLLTEKECLEALKTMESGKSPGTTASLPNFIKFFGRTSLLFSDVVLTKVIRRESLLWPKEEASFHWPLRKTRHYRNWKTGDL